MEFNNKCFHQGDTQWFGIKAIPNNAKKIEKQFVAASERSGSFHALFGNYEQYKVDGGFIIDVKEPCILNHSLKRHLTGSMDESRKLPPKDHRHTSVDPGVYFVGIQQRFDRLKGYKENVKD